MLQAFIIASALVLAYMLMRSLLAKRKQLTRDKNTLRVIGRQAEATAQCSYCQITMALPEAIIDGSEYFCCPQHRREWMLTSQNESEH
jgi:hypothetical protein